MGEKSRYLSFGKKGFTIVFDFPIYKNINHILMDIDKIVYENNGKHWYGTVLSVW